jgi:hypothetical protein
VAGLPIGAALQARLKARNIRISWHELGATRAAEVRAVMQGIRRAKGTAQQQKTVAVIIILRAAGAPGAAHCSKKPSQTHRRTRGRETAMARKRQHRGKYGAGSTYQNKNGEWFAAFPLGKGERDTIASLQNKRGMRGGRR